VLARVWFVLLILALAGCPRPRAATPPDLFAPATDAPWELEDETDWAEVRDQLFGLPAGDRRRVDLRAQLSAAQAVRIGRWLDANRPTLAHEAMVELARLWVDDPAALGVELAAQRATIQRARDVFARAGADQEVVLALVLLAEIEPDRADLHWAELDEVLGFADELATAQHGELAVRARPIQLLEPVAMALPLPKVTDRFVELVAARQLAVTDALGAAGATFDLVRAHGDVLAAARSIASALARAGRAAEIARWLEPMDGIGADATLAAAAARVAAARSSAKDWVKLARAMRSRDDRDDPAGARAVALAGLALHPDDATLAAAAARAAIALDRVHEPIRLFEELRRAGVVDAELDEELSDLYRDRLDALASNDRPVEARARLAELERFFDEVARAHPGRDWDARLARALATVGRGLVNQGELDDAIALLERSVELDPAFEAFEMLSTIAAKRDRWKDARRWAERGASLDGDEPIDSYLRAKLLKLAGDAAAGGGDLDGAREHWIAALSIWADLGDGAQLPPALAGERLVAGGQLLWSLGEKEEALRLLEASVDVDADGAETHIQVVAYFLQQDEYTRALDAFHRAVIADRISDYHKVYMSLWLLAAARRRGVDADPLVVEYLDGRDGVLWHDDLARLATGRIGLAELERRSTSRGRKAELAYYTAVLGLGIGEGQPQWSEAEVRALLEDVVRTEMVLFFEYNMARQLLAAS
jgi:tetratricopeptide (TPR) repeat protein